MTHRLHSFFIGVFTVAGSIVCAQPSLHKLQQNLAKDKQNTASAYYHFIQNPKTPTQASLFFSENRSVPKNELQQWLSDKLELRGGVDAFIEKEWPVNYFGSQVNKLQQLYKGIKVEHGIVSEASINGVVRLLQFEFYPIPANLSITPVVSEEAALQQAMRFVGASKYVWEVYKEGLETDYAKPKGQLVIVEDMNSPGKMCLAYKFNMYAAEPLSRQYVYVDAKESKIVFSDRIIKHLAGENAGQKFQQNIKGATQSSYKPAPQKQGKNASSAFASGFLYYSGTQYFTTDEINPNLFKLAGVSQANNTQYATFNGRHKVIPFAAGDAIDYTDADNDWSEAAYIADSTTAALEIHWGIGHIIDYWWDKHARKSFDHNNGAIVNIYHYGNKYPNAFWNGQGMFYGDGDQSGAGLNAVASVDVAGHELGHAICQYTSNLVYKRESGALNEGFSDIWAACIDNYINGTDSTLQKKPFFIADEIMENGRDGLRDMSAPTNFLQPDTYLDTAGNWFDANVENCPVPIHSDSANGNDFCGVHANSGVLNKWFYLITNGETGFTNGYGETYTIDSMGFNKTERIAYYTEMILTPNSGYEAARIASLMAIKILAASPNALGITEADTVNVSKAWKAVGITTDSVYNMANTPVFSSNQFTSIGTGRRGYIWAGTSNNGLYKFNGKKWQKAGVLTNHNIAQILPDRDGGIWIAQNGRMGTQALSGGIGYFADTSFSNFQMFSNSDGVPTRNIRSIFINNHLPDSQKLMRVWAACFADITAGNNRAGAVTRGLPVPVGVQTFDKIVSGVYPANGFCQTIGGNKNEVWVYANSNTPAGASQILRYRTPDTTFIGAMDFTNTPGLSNTFIAKAIYYDEVKRRWWIGLQTGGLLVRDSLSQSWISVNFPSIFPAGIIVSNNAITGDTRGNIYIGTNQGYIFFGSTDGSSTILHPSNETLYKKYTRANDGLPSDTVRAIALDYRAGRLLLATDQGIAFRYALCKECINTGPAYTVTPGDWSSPGIWASGQVPGLNANVIIRHAVTVTEDANCNSLKTENGGSVTINPGVHLHIESAENPANGY